MLHSLVCEKFDVQWPCRIRVGRKHNSDRSEVASERVPASDKHHIAKTHFTFALRVANFGPFVPKGIGILGSPGLARASRTCRLRYGCCHAHSNCKAASFDGNPWTIICISHGRFLAVFQAPAGSSPLCCLGKRAQGRLGRENTKAEMAPYRSRRGGFGVLPMYMLYRMELDSF